MMTDQRSDIDTVPEDLADNPDSPPAAQDDYARSDIEQAVEARSDAVENGDGSDTPEVPGSVGGTDGVVKNQGPDAQ